MSFNSKIRTIHWTDNVSRVIDQTKLPLEFTYIDIKTGRQMYDAIKNMVVRGAPAIGIAGAHGVTLYALELMQEGLTKECFVKELINKAEFLKSSRPTAVNLAWAVDKQISIIKNSNSDVKKITKELIQNALKMEDDDIVTNKKIGDIGAEIVPDGAGILTHCNAGALATAGYGTALGVIRSAFEKDKSISVFSDETRPRGQGSRLTTFELITDGIPVTMITDGMCSYFMKKGMIDIVITGADRIASNGDTANKIGTYTAAIAARYHNIPFYIAAPLSTVDLSIKTGDEIPIEERPADEVTHINGIPVCHKDTKVINPAFDVTPNELITGIITETGILRPPYDESIKNAFLCPAVIA